MEIGIYAKRNKTFLRFLIFSILKNDLGKIQLKSFYINFF